MISLSLEQERMWLLARSHGPTTMLHERGAAWLDGPLDKIALRHAITQIVTRHEILRTTYSEQDGQPMQSIHPAIDPFREIAVAAGAPDTDEARALALEAARQEAGRPVAVDQGPPWRICLIRLHERRHLLVLVMHHILSDGDRSVQIFFSELLEAYRALREGKTPALPVRPQQYRDHVRWQKDHVDQRLVEHQIAFWHEELEGAPAALDWRIAKPRSEAASLGAGTVNREVDRDLLEASGAFARQEDADLFSVLLAGLQAVLHRYSDQRDVLVGTPLPGRYHAGVEHLIGYFGNPVVVRGRLGHGPTFRQLVRQVAQAVRGAQAHGEVSFKDLVAALAPARERGRSPLFQVLFFLRGRALDPLSCGDLTLTPVDVELPAAAYEQIVSVVETNHGMTWRVEYSRDLFDEHTIIRQLGHWEVLLRAAVADPDLPVRALPLLTEPERHEILEGWNDTEGPLPERCIHELFEAAVERCPQATAVILGEQSLTYRELNRQANQLAHHLRHLGVAPDVLVGIFLERSLKMMVAVLATLKAGGAYVPLDPHYPRDRLAFIVTDSKATVLLTSEALASQLPAMPGTRIVALDTEATTIARQSEHNPVGGALPDAIACVSYTSGSTGQPKGVGMPHRPISNLLNWQRSAAPAVRKTLQLSSLSFDVSQQEMFSMYLSGGTLVLVPEQISKNLGALASYIHDQGIERLFVPFVALRHLAQILMNEGPRPTRLCEIITAGEQLQITPEIAALCETCGCSLENQYGPTETHVVTAHRLRGAPAGWPALPPIGRPITNARIYLLDERLAPVPAGVPGEVYIGGACIARGYLGRPELTAQRFLPDPFARQPGCRMYRTGDLSRHLPDGSLEYLGRNDHQVKIRGFRIEPGEIEFVLTQHPAVQSAAVVAHDDGLGVKRLVAYVIAADGGTFEPGELLRYTRSRLPDHMVPTAVIPLSAFPLTPSGKLDRRALPLPEHARLGANTDRPEGEGAHGDPASALALEALRERTPGSSAVDRRTLLELVIRARMSQLLRVPARELHSRQTFAQLGMDSLLLISLTQRLGVDLDVRIPATAVWSYPSIEQLADHLVDRLDGARAPAGPPRIAQRGEPDRSEPIAVVGLGCRFPGGAEGPEAFWRVLRGGVNAIGVVPRQRWDIDAIYHPEAGTPGRISTRYGAFLDQVDRFDAAFFDIAPREAMHMDPQQRLLLEVAWEALEDAGLAAERMAGSQAGVFMGVAQNDYYLMQFSDPARVGIYSATGTVHNTLAGRLSYVLDLHGPCIAVDTACSASLVAVHLAMQSLRSGECSVALAGGVSLLLDPAFFICISHMRMLAPDGCCKAFDASADGMSRGEGCGVIVLKRLSDALADGDRITAVLRGSAVNQDGHTNGITAPNGLAQQAVIRAALANAGVDPGQITYVEAHGTGTPLGDPIELEGLKELYGRAADSGACAVGAVKTNLGHLEAAAGIAGLIKVLLCLSHRTLAPNLHFRTLNPHVSLEGSRLHIPTEPRPWQPSSGTRIAAVSSFGWSGTNAHVIVEEAPDREREAPSPAETRSGAARTLLLPLSARSPAALRDMAGRMSTWLQSPAGREARLEDVCYTASVRRTHHEHRLVVLGSDGPEVSERLAAFASGESPPGLVTGRRSADATRQAVFVFSGHGSQWAGMARALHEAEPVFREAIEQCDEALRRAGSQGVREGLLRCEATPRPDELELVQQEIFAVQVALAAQWRALGVEPSAVVGHSLGEIAAAHVAGILTLDDGARVIHARGRLVRERAQGTGGLLSTQLTPAEAEALARDFHGRLAIAVVNSPTSVVLSGEEGALRALEQQLQARGLFCKRVQIGFAAHGPAMPPIGEALGRELRGLRPQPERVPFLSTVTGRLESGTVLDAGYWARNLAEPVQFAAALQALARSGHGDFLEIDAHPVLVQSMEENLAHVGVEGVVVASLLRDRGAPGQLLEGLARLHCTGYPVDLHRVYPPAAHRVVSLPGYPWQRERYWLPEGPPRAQASIPRGGQGHPLLDLGTRVAFLADEVGRVWDLDLGVDTLPYLADHRVTRMAVFPGAGYLELALAAAREVFQDGPVQLRSAAFTDAMMLPDEGSLLVQLSLTGDLKSGARFRITSQRHEDKAESSWTSHVSGEIAALTQARPDAEPLEAIRQRCVDAISSREHYRLASALQLHYGPAFQGIDHIVRNEGESLARLRWPESLGASASGYGIHPALLDASFQAVLTAMGLDKTPAMQEGSWMPVQVQVFRVWSPVQPGSELWAHTRVIGKPGTDAAVVDADVRVLDGQGKVLVEVAGMRLKRVRATAREQLSSRWMYIPRWQELDVAESPEADVAGTWLLLVDRGGVGQALRLALEARGARCMLVLAGDAFHQKDTHVLTVQPSRPEDFRQLLGNLDAAGGPPLRGVVHLWSLDATLGDEGLPALERSVELGCISTLHLVQALCGREGGEASKPPRLWLITRGAQVCDADEGKPAVEQSALWGLGRTIASEHPQLACTRVDLAGGRTRDVAGALLRVLTLPGREDELLLRGNRCLVARLDRHDPTVGARSAPTVTVVPGQDAFRLEIEQVGSLDRLAVHTCARRPVGPGEVEIAVRAAGLNFRDVLKALGDYPGALERMPPLGDECAGIVTAVGEGVAGLRVGDEVLAAIVPHAFSSFVTVRNEHVVHKPAGLSFAQAATLASVFLTAWYSLVHQARLGAGERVLIHAAAGGVGLAAVQIAMHLGAEVYATAGSAEKRDFLRALGVRHVLDSRSLAFADEVRRLTQGQGVDVVLNSLAGEFIPASLSLLRPMGRFLELGKKDVHGNTRIGLELLKHSASFHVVDLGLVAHEQPALIARLLREVTHGIEQDWLQPICRNVFSLSRAEDAFRFMAQARHIGKIALSLEEETLQATVGRPEEVAFRGDRTYLITGGLGGLGLEVARWMVERGARHLVLVGRSGPEARARQSLAALAEAGAQVSVQRGDVSAPEEVARVLRETDASLPPLAGILHAAGALHDSTLLQMDQVTFKAALAPKVAGAWNLHQMTRDRPLDHFVMFSSMAGLLGTSGQGNYAAGNSFLDGLAWHRRATGLPALSIDWGSWSEVGMAAAQANRGERLATQGLESLSPSQGLDALGRVMRQDHPQVAVVRFDASRWRASVSAGPYSLLADLASTQAETAADTSAVGAMRNRLLSAERAERISLLMSHIKTLLARVLDLRTEPLEDDTAFRSVGMDSLTSLELRNRLESSLELRFSAAALFTHPTIHQLAVHLVERLSTAQPGG